MIDTPSSAVSREEHLTHRPCAMRSESFRAAPVGVQGPESHSVDQAATAALKSLVRSTLKSPVLRRRREALRLRTGHGVQEISPSRPRSPLADSDGKQLVKGRHSVIEDRARQERASASNSGPCGTGTRWAITAASGLVGRRRLRRLPAFGLLEANLARPSRILSLMLKR